MSDHAMDVFVENTTVERRNSIERAKGGRPVRNGKSGVVAGDEGAKDDQPKYPACRENGEAMVSPVVTDACGRRKRLL